MDKIAGRVGHGADLETPPGGRAAFRRLNAPELLPAVYAGAGYVDGVQQRTIAQKEIAA